MEQRISHWAAVGLIYNIASIQDTVLSSLVKGIEESESDRRLACELTSFAKIKDGWQTLSENPQPHHDAGPRKLPPHNLLSACRTAPYILYNETTHLEFHHLLVASTVTFAYFLRHLNEAPVAQRPNFAPMVLVVGRLLSAIVQSNAFKCHINLLTKLGPLKLPNYASIQEYREFTTQTYIRIRLKSPDNTSRAPPEPPTADAPFPDNKTQVSLEPPPAELPPNETQPLLESPTASPDKECQAPLEFPTADEPELEEDAELDSQEDAELDPPSSDDVTISNTSSVIQAWLQYLVIYFEAYRIVKYYCASLGKGDGTGEEDDNRSIRISILGTTPSKRELPQWTTVQSIIRSVLDNPDHRYSQASDANFLENLKPSAENIIQFLETSIESAKEMSSSVPSVVRTFATILDNKVRVPAYYTVHCEAALAAYAAMHVMGSEASDEPAADVLKVLFVSFSLSNTSVI